MTRALRAELLKLRRAPVPLWTALAVAVVPALTASSVRMVDGSLDHTTWTSFMALAPQMMASWWGVLIFGLATAYMFGREYLDGTAKNMLTLPVRREAFVVAKLIVLAGWLAALTLVAVALQAAFALVLGVPGFAWGHIWRAVVDCLEIAGLIFLTLPAIGALAVLERGYLPPMMVSALMATAAFLVGAIGWGRFFPWSMPLAVAGSAFGPLIEPPVLEPASFAISGTLFAVGLAVLLAYIDRADNTQ